MDYVTYIFSSLDAQTAFSTLLGAVLGVLSSWLASSVYYRKAGDELKHESELLRKANMAVVYMLEHPDAEIEVRRDEQGNPVALIVAAQGNAKIQLATRNAVLDGNKDGSTN